MSNTSAYSVTTNNVSANHRLISLKADAVRVAEEAAFPRSEPPSERPSASSSVIREGIESWYISCADEYEAVHAEMNRDGNHYAMQIPEESILLFMALVLEKVSH
jgi:hypothetical protein